MNRLLKRQIKKHLTEDLINNPKVISLLDAIEKSYENYEDQIDMTQRAMKISSDELYEINVKLRAESETNKETINNIKQIVKTLNLKSAFNPDDSLDINEVSTYIQEQSKEIALVSKEREEILRNLEKRNKVLSEYAHMISHDLKSPLRNINTMISWIMEDYDTLASSDEFKLVLMNLEKMDFLITGILEYSTIDSLKTEKKLVNLHNLILEVIETLECPDNTKIKIINELPTIPGDNKLFRKIFKNIIHNAIKSIDKEEGLIEVGAENKDTYWQFFIRDNGKGIKETFYSKIFQIFQKIDDDNAATGIGLAIVKKILDLYNGKIWLNSEVGKYTTFYFTLPKK